ncbi:MAG: SPOR domain-containing protein [Bacteroidota bacterium]|nr:SPOR domain-containing protein [Bacteroidota bacterium]
MTSEKVLIEITAIVREQLLQHDRVDIPGLGSLKIEFIPSVHELLEDGKFVVHPTSRRISFKENPAIESSPSLIPSLAAKLGVADEGASEVLNLLVTEILSQLPVRIPELGTFTRSDDGLQFAADPELAAVVSGTYAGLSSITVGEEIAPQPIQRRQRWPWAAAAMIVVAAGIYLITQGSNESDDPAEETTVISTLIIPDSASTDSIKTVAIEDNVDQEPPTVPDPETETGPETLILDHEAGGYTLIVASFPEESTALEVAERYRNIYPDIPIGILRSSDDTNHRVAVGQASTITEALDLKSQLNDLPPEAWVLSIRDVGI